MVAKSSNHYPPPDGTSGSARDYQRIVDTAIDCGLAERNSNRVKVHIPLVRRVAWTASAWTDLTAMFGDPLKEAPPRDSVLEVALDSAAYALSTQLPAAAGSKVAELGFMWGQYRLMYLLEPDRVVILALVPSLARWHRGTGDAAS